MKLKRNLVIKKIFNLIKYRINLIEIDSNHN